MLNSSTGVIIHVFVTGFKASSYHYIICYFANRKASHVSIVSTSWPFLQVSLSFSPGNLPQTLPEETYFCHFNSSDLSSPFAVPLVNGTCDVRMLVNQMTNIKLG